MITHYFARFQIEMNSRELKGSMGDINYQVRSRQSIHNYLHIAFVAYALQKYISVSGQSNLGQRLGTSPQVMFLRSMCRGLYPSHFKPYEFLRGYRKTNSYEKY